MYIMITSSTPHEAGRKLPLGIYFRPFSSIDIACAVRQPGPCVRAFCLSGVLFHISHLKLHFALHISHCILHTPHTPHSTLHTSTLHTLPHFTLRTPNFTLHTPHFTVHTSHCFLHTRTLHTSLFMPHTSHCTLHTPRFISSEIFSPYPSSSLLSSHLFPYVI